MGWSKIGLLTLFLFIIFTVSAFGGHFGYTVDGVPQSQKDGRAIEDMSFGEILWSTPEDWKGNEAEPGITSLIGDAVGFLYAMMTFQIDGMPELISMIFVVMSLLSLIIIVSMFLPGGSG